MRNSELMVATLRIYNVAYCMERFVVLNNYGLIGKVRLPLRTRHAVSLRLKTNVSCISVGDGFLHVPKRYLYINLKFGLQFSPNKPTFPLDLRAEALG